MSPERTEAFLLRATPYGEADLVVMLLTRRHGRLSALARGARKSRRRFGGALDYFHLLEAEVRPGRSGLGRLQGVELLRAFETVRGGVDAYWAGSHVLEVARLAAREGDPDEGLFRLVEESLAALDRGVEPTGLTRVFQARALAVLGYELPLSCCPACGEPYPEPYGSRPAAHAGGAVACAPCAGPAAPTLSAGAWQTLRAAVRLPLDRLGTLRVPAGIQGEVGPLLDEALVSCLGARPRSLEGLGRGFDD